MSEVSSIASRIARGLIAPFARASNSAPAAPTPAASVGVASPKNIMYDAPLHTELMMSKLTTGDDFPNLTLNLTDGGTLELPRDIDTNIAIMLFYRGYW